jgi:hypothetical protein
VKFLLVVLGLVLTLAVEAASLQYDYTILDMAAVDTNGPWILLRSWRAATLEDLQPEARKADNFSSFLISGPVQFGDTNALTNCVKVFFQELSARCEFANQVKLVAYSNSVPIQTDTTVGVTFTTEVDKSQPYQFYKASAENVWLGDTNFVALIRRSLNYPALPPMAMTAVSKVGKLDMFAAEMKVTKAMVLTNASLNLASPQSVLTLASIMPPAVTKPPSLPAMRPVRDPVVTKGPLHIKKELAPKRVEHAPKVRQVKPIGKQKK